MRFTWQRLFFVAGIAAAAVAVAGCQGTTSSGNDVLPAQMAQSNHASLAKRLPREILYATTLDWNTGTGSVYFYAAYGKNTSALGSLSIKSGFPDGAWTDSRGDVYVAVVNSVSNGRGYINVYTPGLGKLLRTYGAGLDGPSGGTFDLAGNMYVANLCGTAPSIQCFVFAKRHGSDVHQFGDASGGTQTGYVAIYPPGKMQPSTYLLAPINIAVGVAVDHKNNVFAVNNTGGIAWNVIEFPAGSTQGRVVRFRGLPKSRWVGADAFDPKGELVTSVNSAIDFFPHESGKPGHQLTNVVVAADGLAYGPDGSLFAGNYEFESNEGNIVAFPPGATAPARTYAVPYGNGVVSVAVGRR